MARGLLTFLRFTEPLVVAMDDTLDQLDADSEGFVTPAPTITKPPEFHLPLTSAVLYANTG